MGCECCPHWMETWKEGLFIVVAGAGRMVDDDDLV